MGVKSLVSESLPHQFPKDPGALGPVEPLLSRRGRPRVARDGRRDDLEDELAVGSGRGQLRDDLDEFDDGSCERQIPNKEGDCIIYRWACTWHSSIEFRIYLSSLHCVWSWPSIHCEAAGRLGLYVQFDKERIERRARWSNEASRSANPSPSDWREKEVDEEQLKLQQSRRRRQQHLSTCFRNPWKKHTQNVKFNYKFSASSISWNGRQIKPSFSSRRNFPSSVTTNTSNINICLFFFPAIFFIQIRETFSAYSALFPPRHFRAIIT